MNSPKKDEARTEVCRIIMRLIDYGKGREDRWLQELTIGEVADHIIEVVRNGSV